MTSESSRRPIHLQSKLPDDIPSEKPMQAEMLEMIKIVNTDSSIGELLAENLYFGRDDEITFLNPFSWAVNANSHDGEFSIAPEVKLAHQRAAMRTRLQLRVVPGGGFIVPT